MTKKPLLYKVAAIVFFMTIICVPSLSEAVNHRGTITFKVELLGAEKAEISRLWLPYPLSDASQTISKADIKSDALELGVENDPRNGAVYLAAAWEKPQKTPALTLRCDVDSHYKKFEELRESDAPFPPEVLPYLEGSDALPLDDPMFADLVKKLKAETSVLKRARLVYDWVIENTFRDNSVMVLSDATKARPLTYFMYP